MYENLEFRSVVRFLLLKGLQKNEIVIEIQSAYKNQSPCTATIYNWIREFKCGRTNIHDAERSGRPIEIGDEKSLKLQKIIRSERRITQSQIANRINISKYSVQTMLSQLGVRKLCSRFVPRFLTAEMRQMRKEACQQNLELFVETRTALIDNLITMDETSLSLFTTEGKRESSEWRFQDEKPPKKLKCATTTRKCLMLSVFWNRMGVIKLDFTKEKLNADYYCALLEDVRKIKRKPRNDFIWFHHDNAPIHTAQKTRNKMNELGLHCIAQPPYSPDLAPSDFYLFHRLKKYLKGHLFENSDELQKTATEYFNGLEPDFFSKAFDELIKRWQKCFDSDGDYIEN